jgi:hypothetical protein
MADVLESVKELVKVSSGGNPILIFLGALLFLLGLAVIGCNALVGTILILAGILLIFF